MMPYDVEVFYDGACPLCMREIGKRIRKFETQEGVIFAVAFSPDGSRIAVAGAADEVPIYQTETGERTEVFQLSTQLFSLTSQTGDKP